MALEVGRRAACITRTNPLSLSVEGRRQRSSNLLASRARVRKAAYSSFSVTRLRRLGVNDRLTLDRRSVGGAIIGASGGCSRCIRRWTAGITPSNGHHATMPRPWAMGAAITGRHDPCGHVQEGQQIE
jgi:hypothetical protein